MMTIANAVKTAEQIQRAAATAAAIAAAAAVVLTTIKR